MVPAVVVLGYGSCAAGTASSTSCCMLQPLPKDDEAEKVVMVVCGTTIPAAPCLLCLSDEKQSFCMLRLVNKFSISWRNFKCDLTKVSASRCGVDGVDRE